MPVETISDASFDPPIRGFLHTPEHANLGGFVLTHGAGGNANGPMLVSLSELFASAGYMVLRCDLPFRQERKTGPPHPGNAARDRDGLRSAVEFIRQQVAGKIFLGGQSYGGRQATMLCAENQDLVSGLLLLSYPLHAPGRPEQLRVQHFPNLRTPCLFVHGTRDAFGSTEEFNKALPMIPARHELLEVEGAGHDLGFAGKKKSAELPGRIGAAFKELFP